MFPVEKSEIADTLILGVGNLLLADEGVGIHVVERLQELYDLPETVQALDGGTLGMDLLYYLEGTRRLLIVDAVETGDVPGTVIRLEGDEVPSQLATKMSPHQMGVPDMLFAAKLRDLYPEKIVLLGVQPDSLEPSLDLSPTLAVLVDPLVAQVVAELARWGVPVEPRQTYANISF
jgi:hydrogenase maturation protease